MLGVKMFVKDGMDIEPRLRASMDPARRSRQEEISNSLAFIQSSLAFPEPEAYQDFLTRLVCNLLEEGNASFRCRDWEQAVREFSEGIRVSQYATREDVHIPEALPESLYVNRAAAYHSMGEYELAVEDCNSALTVCKESHRALYRKALSLKELRKYKEAYTCTTDCLLITRLDKQVNELAQELAVQLGLKKRKPYVVSKDAGLIMKSMSNGNLCAETIKVSGNPVGNGVNPLSGLAPAPSCRQSAVSSVPKVVDTAEDSELMGDDLDSLLDCSELTETPTRAACSVPSKTSTSECTAPSVLPAPTPQLPPAFFSSAISQLNSLDSFSGGGGSTTPGLLDDLDDLLISGAGGGASATVTSMDGLDGLDSLDDFLDTTPSAAAGNESKTEVDGGERSLDNLLDELDPLDPGGQNGEVANVYVKPVEQLDSLDALDSFPLEEGVVAALPATSFSVSGLDTLSDFQSTGITGSHTAAVPVTQSSKNNYKERNSQASVAAYNPLSSTHEFLQACSTCFPRTGQGIYSFVHKPDLVHNCKRDILLCRLKASPWEWTRVRQLHHWKSFSGPFVLCREVLNSGDLGFCKFGENCTFAYNQLEIDVWTEERKGTLDRNLLFETAGSKPDPRNYIIHLMQEHKGMFIFLCQECFDNKPRLISQRCRDNRTFCSNLDARHTFDTNKCLVFVVKMHSVNYEKVRPLGGRCNLNMCHRTIRHGCQREDSCLYAHSLIELKTWRVQLDTGISPDEIVKVSTKYNGEQEYNSSKQKGNRLSSGGGGSKPRGGGGGGVGKSLNMKMKFICGQCWQAGMISEPNKALKHCTAKAKHTWTKEKCVLLVKSLERNKWVQVRPLPRAKTLPVQYDICAHVLEKRKCNYSGNCFFAHSQEEKEMWMYMKNNDLRDMLQIYDMWQVSLTTVNQQADEAMLTKQVPEEKCIIMPTDYAEPMTGFHCRLCGKHSNGERQWQQHISSEKHKDRVFSCEGEDEALTWRYRFPGPCFQLCPKVDGGCSEGVSCDYAHSLEELQEWTERRDFLRQKLAKAREDMLVMPDDFDFGKFNFLLHN